MTLRHLNMLSTHAIESELIQNLDLYDLFNSFSSKQALIKTAGFGKEFFTFCVVEAALWILLYLTAIYNFFECLLLVVLFKPRCEF